MNLGEKIYELRTKKNLSQGDLADALQVSRQSVSKWENDTAVPDLDKLIKLCDIFEISIDEIVGREKPQKKSVSKWLDFKKSLTKTQNIGCVLAAITLLCLIVPLGRFFTFSFGACAIICLFVKKYAWYWCVWAWYLPIQFLINNLNIDFYITNSVEIAFAFVMIIVAYLCFKGIEIKTNKKTKKLLMVLSSIYSIVYVAFLSLSAYYYEWFDNFVGGFSGRLIFAPVNFVLTVVLAVAMIYVVSYIREARQKK